jgi:hypothetical protein
MPILVELPAIHKNAPSPDAYSVYVDLVAQQAIQENEEFASREIVDNQL